MTTKHKTFISYHHANDEQYKIAFKKIFADIHDIIVPWDVEIGDIDPNLKTDTIRRKIRDEYLIIRLMADNQEKEFDRLNLNFHNLWGRKLQLIDCQNIFCEVDKYSRVAHPHINGYSHRTRIKQKFTDNEKEPIEFYFPPKWGINNLKIN
jgi:hypothetical protein